MGAIVVCYGGGKVANCGGVGRFECHCWVPLQAGSVTTNFGGVPLQGAIVVCYGWGKVTTNFGGVDVVPLQGAIVWGKGRVTANFGGVDVVPLQGAIVVCYGGGRGGWRLSWGSGRGAIAGCHCRVPL